MPPSCIAWMLIFLASINSFLLTLDSPEMHVNCSPKTLLQHLLGDVLAPSVVRLSPSQPPSHPSPPSYHDHRLPKLLSTAVDE